MRARLCMVVHGDYPLDPRVAREARAARDAGYAVDVVAMRRRGESAYEEVDGVRVFRLPFTHRRGVGTVALLFEYVGFTVAATLVTGFLSVRNRYEIVHIHNPPDFLIAAATIPKLFGARAIFDVHDLSPDMFDMRFGTRRGARLIDKALRLAERAATRIADQVITVHDAYRRELILRGVPPERALVVMNTVDERLLPVRRRPNPNLFRIVYHGRVTPHYGVELLVDAYARIRDLVPCAVVEIYGEGDSIRTVKRRAVELGCADRVRISDRIIPQSDVLELVADASVGVVPNRPTRLNRFALSSKLFEYVALGIPVVCADLPTIREHFGDDEIRYFRAGDPSDLAVALMDLARDPVRAGRRASAARQRYDRYRWPEQARRYVALLDAFVSSSNVHGKGRTRREVST